MIYNDIDLMALETHQYLWEAVYDDSMTNYLYSRVTLHVTAMVNGQVQPFTQSRNMPFMSYTFDTIPPPPNTSPSPRAPVGYVAPDSNLKPTPAVAGITVGNSDQSQVGVTFGPTRPLNCQKTVRQRLNQPQRQLIIFSDSPGQETGAKNLANGFIPADKINLISPLYGDRCDCKNGPFPKVFDVSSVMSQDNTLIVDFGIETFVNEAMQNGISPSGGLLSNQFKQRHIVSDTGYTTVQTQGVAIFRTDFVYRYAVNPDTERAILFMPIPQGFERMIDYVEGMPDVTGIAYGYTDTQVPVNFVAGPYAKAAKIVAVHRQAITTNADVLKGALTTYDRIQSATLNNKWIREANERQEQEEKATKRANKKKKAKAKQSAMWKKLGESSNPPSTPS